MDRYLTIYPALDDFDAPDDVEITALADPSGAVFWYYRHILVDDREGAEEWLISKIARLNGEPIGVIDLHEKPELQDPKVAIALSAHIDLHLSRFLQPRVKVSPAKQAPDGNPQLWESDDKKHYISVRGDLDAKSIRHYRQLSQKSPQNALKWGMTQAFSFDGKPLARTDFPKMDGGQTIGGNEAITWEGWAVCEAYFLKTWFAPYLNRSI
ncbi:MAG: hypothetical protein J7642_21335 [Cyanobacteria bacterium SBC]|nr:hypothetical protein [Cyanobacteria bacterium SBC]